MITVKAGHEVIEERDPFLKIEKVARSCYKSEDKICEGSAKKMVANLIKREHYAMLEHSSIIIRVDNVDEQDYTNMILYDMEREADSSLCGAYRERSFLRVTEGTAYLISGNIRAWREYLEYIMDNPHYRLPKPLLAILLGDKYRDLFLDVVPCSRELEVEPDKYKEVDPVADWDKYSDEEWGVHYDLTIRFTCDRGVSHEIVRHRKASFAQESTRYVNYGKMGMQFIEPTALKFDEDAYEIWDQAMRKVEVAYLRLLSKGCSPQAARSVLPNSIKTEVTVTANLNEWVHFFNLRALGTTGAPHPQMVEVAMPCLVHLAENYKFTQFKEMV